MLDVTCICVDKPVARAKYDLVTRHIFETHNRLLRRLVSAHSTLVLSAATHYPSRTSNCYYSSLQVPRSGGCSPVAVANVQRPKRVCRTIMHKNF